MRNPASAHRRQETSTHASRTEPTRKWARALLWTLGTIVLLLIVVQLIASPIAKRVINSKLEKMEDFRGRVEGVNVAVWRGGADLSDIVIHQRGHESDAPVVKIKKASGKIAVPHLLAGKLMAELMVDGAELTAVKNNLFGLPRKAKEKVDEKESEVGPWQDALRKAFPVEVTKFEMKNSKMRYIDRSHSPEIDVAIDQLHVIASGLKNRQEGDPLPAKVTVKGVTSGDGQLRIEAQADPLAKSPTFVTKFELRQQQLRPLNPLLLAYAGADVGSGIFELFTEIKAENGAYNGYTKPFFKDVDFKTAEDKDKRLGQKVKESVADVVNKVLENDRENKVATEAPLSGNFAQNQVDVWETISGLLRNAFVEALRGGFGRQARNK